MIHNGERRPKKAEPKPVRQPRDKTLIGRNAPSNYAAAQSDLAAKIDYLEGVPNPKTFHAFMRSVKNGQIRVRGFWVDLAPYAERLTELENQIVVMDVIEA